MKQEGLPGHLQKHLAEIVEANGGIKSFGQKSSQKSSQKFAKLLDNYQNEYGERGSLRCCSTRNKFYKWQKLSEADYLRLLHKLQVTPHAIWQEQHKNLASIEDSDSESEESIKKNPKPARVTFTIHSTMKSTTVLPPKTTVVKFDPNNPECHKGVAAVFKAKDIVGADKKTFYEGFDIWLEVDIR